MVLPYILKAIGKLFGVKEPKRRPARRSSPRIARRRVRPGPKPRNSRFAAPQPIGVVTHYFSKIQVVVVKVTGRQIKVGDQIHIRGKATDFRQRVSSLQIESLDVQAGRKGQLVGMKVSRETRPGDRLFLMSQSK